MVPKKRDRRKLGARPYKNYSDEMLSRAVNMVQNKNMSTYEAEKQFKIPRRTIERKIKKLHMKKPGSPQRLTEEEELNFVKVLIAVSDYGAPLTLMDLRILVNEYLLKNNKSYIFDGKLPGDWWARSFIERHRDKLTIRSVQNIKRARAEKTLTEFQNYFENLENVVKNVPPTHLLNYDETNFSDNPGSVKCIFRRGIKYPERLMNSTKASISVMFAGSADGKVLPPYVVYKSDNIFDQWVIGGPDKAHYNRTKSGWFDSSTFLNWFNVIIVPWARKLEGIKVIIGDNLCSHINLEVIELCEKYDIKFVLLPPNSTQLTQPLDVAFFGPLKKTWRKILTHYKVENPRQASLNKCHFPTLLKKVMDDVNMGKKENVASGFKATGIYPFNPQKVFKKLPEYTSNEPEYSVDQVLLDYLKETRKPNEMKRGRKKKLKVESGMSVTISDLTKKELPTENQIREKISGTKKIKKGKTDESTTKLRKLEMGAEIDGSTGLQRNITAIKKNKIGKRKLETDVKSDNFTGLESNITVKVCGTLSDSEDSDSRNKENNKPTTSKKNKKRKCIKKAINKKKKKKPIKISKNVESESTTTEDIEISIHSDSDIIDIGPEEEDYYKIQCDNKISAELIDFEDIDVARNVDMIEKEIFESIEKIDQDDIETEDRGLHDPRILNEKPINDEEHVSEEDPNAACKLHINYKYSHENDNNLTKNECKWHKGETVLTRYFSSHKWKYYIGIIEKVNNSEKVYSVSYYKTIVRGDNITFVQPKRADKDSSLPENCVIKSINLLQTENPAQYTLVDDEDIVYFH